MINENKLTNEQLKTFSHIIDNENKSITIKDFNDNIIKFQDIISNEILIILINKLPNKNKQYEDKQCSYEDVICAVKKLICNYHTELDIKAFEIIMTKLKKDNIGEEIIELFYKNNIIDSEKTKIFNKLFLTDKKIY